MAPIKAQTKPLATNNSAANILRRGISTRSQQVMSKPLVPVLKDMNSKRKANSPLKELKNVKQIDLGLKRSAFGDITNASVNNTINDTKKTLKDKEIKKVTAKTKYLPTVKTVNKQQSLENIPPKAATRTTTTKVGLKTTVSLSSAATKSKAIENKIKTSRNNSVVSAQSDDSLYVSALEELSDSIKKSEPVLSTTSSHKTILSSKKVEASPPAVLTLPEPEIAYPIPNGVNDFDRENWDDIYQVSHYAMDIFNYLKERESHFKIKDYMSHQPHISAHMRSLLVDWMVEVQESFELNHETLYLAVKLVDMYLNKIQVNKDILQLVGAASLFIASKFDERIPPLIDDFLYICDGAYNRPQMLKMEMSVLQHCNFEMGIPLSYRFLRRYARCAKISMPTLTLARYILEYSLMDYTTVTQSDSKLAAASLYLALRMEKISGWTKTLEYYSGYKLEEFMPQVEILNKYLHKPQKSTLNTIRSKYSHKIFHEVAKIPLVVL